MRKFAFLGCFLGISLMGYTEDTINFPDHLNGLYDSPDAISLRDVLWAWESIYSQCSWQVDLLWFRLYGVTYTTFRQDYLETFHALGIE